jgi:[ribosomal protein S18]-alanine N-acetyltransferase
VASSPVTVRPMAPADLDGVCEIERAVFALPWSRKSFEDEVSGDPCSVPWVAEEDGRVVGYLVAWHVADELHIGNLAVAPAKQGGGIGASLLSGALAAAAERGIEYAALEVRVSNERAIRLYERFGFSGIAIRKAYYEDNGENALIMLRVIGGGAGGPAGQAPGGEAA